MLYWKEYTYWLNILFCTGISLLARYFVLEYPYWVDVVYWNILTGLMLCTGISLLAGYLVYWNILTGWISP
jgi:hypothetical protein